MGDALSVVEEFASEGVLWVREDCIESFINISPGSASVDCFDSDLIELLDEVSSGERFCERCWEVSCFGAVVGGDVVSHRVVRVGGRRGRSL